MKINIYRRTDCAKAQGLCVIIDVLRAFTTAAFAFAAGAKEIILVSSIEEALKLYEEDNRLILMGEQGGKFTASPCVCFFKELAMRLFVL